jgi:putative ABC transport system permease protein
MLGIIIGVAAVIAMVSIGNGAKAQVEERIASLGENVILVLSGSTSRAGVRSGLSGSPSLTIDDAEAIEREVAGISTLSPEVRTSTQVISGNQNWNTTVLGESPNYLDIRQWQLDDGAVFSDQDVRGANKVALIGSTVVDQLFGDENPLGQIIRVKHVPFVIVGTLATKGLSVTGSDQDDVVIVPFSSAMKRVTGTTAMRSINVQVEGPELIEQVQEEITQLLRQRHRIQEDRDDDFVVRNQQELAEAATATSRTMRLLLGAIASVSLVVGGIGIMNIMLVSVSERTREIGIRRAVGARARDILRQFLIEAITLSSIGGLVGVGLGIGTSWILSVVAQWPALTSPESVVMAFAVSAAIGVFFGYYPARKASELDPIDALRYE